jgi:hypothetical protein
VLVRVAASIILCLGLLAATAAAPTFAGKWVIDWALTDAANAELGGPGEPHGDSSPWTITQDTHEVTIQQGNRPARRYKLDGTDSINVFAGGITQVSQAKLESAALRIVTKGPQGSATTIYTIEKDTLKSKLPASATAPTRTGRRLKTPGAGTALGHGSTAKSLSRRDFTVSNFLF